MARRVDETRERLLLCAEREFSRGGYHGTALRTILAAAGLSKGGFYHHFRSKESLFVEVLRRLLQSGIEEPAGSGTTEERMREFFLAPLRRNPDYLALVFDGVKSSEEVAERVGALFRDHIGGLVELLEAGKQSGEVREHIDSLFWAFQIVSLLEGAFLCTVLTGGTSLSDYLPRMFEALWRNLRRLDI